MRRLSELYYNQKGLCHYCGCKTRISILPGNYPNKATIDHKVPKSNGGTNDIDNLVMACTECNRKKSSISYEEFMLTYPSINI